MKQVVIKRFPEDLHRRVKVFAALNNTTMKQVIIDALKRYLEEKGGELNG